MPRTSLQRARAGAAPLRDNARPDPAAGLDMLLQIRSRCFGFPRL